MGIEVDYKQNCQSNPTRVALMIKDGENLLFTDNIDLSRRKQHGKYLDDLIKDHPGLEQCREQIADRMKEILQALLNGNDEGSAPKEEVRPLELSKLALVEMDEAVVNQAEKMLTQPRLVEMILEHIHRLGVVGEKPLALAVYLIATSRLLPRPLAGIILGSSSSGKSYCPDTVAKLFPDESKLMAHRMTPAALNHMRPGELTHRMVFGGERSRQQDDDAAEATRSLREMLSDGVLRLATVEKDEEGELRTVIKEQAGPIAYTESTTLALNKIFDEDRTRFIVLGTDESKEQTVAIMGRMASDAYCPRGEDEREAIIELHHAIQRMLEPLQVSIPFASMLVGIFPAQRVEARRAFGSLLSLIRAVTLLHQKQRGRNDEGWVVAQAEDYEVVRQYLTSAVAVGLGHGLTPGAQRVLDIIADNYGVGDNDLFTVNQLADDMDASTKTVYPKVSELRDRGFLSLAEPGRGSTPGKYRRVAYPKGDNHFELPPFQKLMEGGAQETKKQTGDMLISEFV